MIPIVHYLSDKKKHVSLFESFLLLVFICPVVDFILGPAILTQLAGHVQEMSGLKETVPFEKRAAEAQRILRTSA